MPNGIAVAHFGLTFTLCVLPRFLPKGSPPPSENNVKEV